MKTEYSELDLPFKGGFKITQFFGERPDYYKKWGFAGHEGLDCVPLGSGWDIYCIEGGEVIRDVDVPRDNYGNYVLVWNEKNRRGWWYCHLQLNFVAVGDRVRKGQMVGRMGASGLVTGAHLHLGLRYGDEKRNPINLDNGFKGFVDPLPVVLQLLGGMAETISVPKDDFERLVGKASHYDDLVAGKDVDGKRLEDTDYTARLRGELEDARNEIERRENEIKELTEKVKSLASDIADKQAQIVKLTGQNAELHEKLAQVETSDHDNSVELHEAQQKVQALEERFKTLEKRYGQLESENEKLKDEKLELRETIRELEKKLSSYPHTATPPENASGTPLEPTDEELEGFWQTLVKLLKRVLGR